MYGVEKVYVLGSGYQLTKDVNVVSNGVGYLDVYLLAYNEDGLTIYCNETDTCTIYCGMCE